MQIDWGDLEVPESTAEIDWDHVGQLDASDILVVEDSVEGQTSFEPGHINPPSKHNNYCIGSLSLQFCPVMLSHWTPSSPAQVHAVSL